MPAQEGLPLVKTSFDSSSSGRKHGFTLVELLTVIAIIGVLAGIIIPVASNVRMTANRAKCASNMRQIGTGLHLYANDNKGYLPMTTESTLGAIGDREEEIKASWIYQLSGYVGNVDEIRICPADEPERQTAIRNNKATSYLLNNIVFDPDEYSPAYNRLQNIPNPTRTLLAIIGSRPVSQTWDHAHCRNWTSWGRMLDDLHVDRHRTGSQAADRLKGSANYLYADGHVENIEARDLKARVDSGVNPGAVPL